MPNSLKARLKKLVYQGILSQEDLDRIIVVPKDATNGDVIKKVFPSIEINDNDSLHFVYTGIYYEGLIGINIDATRDWWNATYKCEPDDINFNDRRMFMTLKETMEEIQSIKEFPLTNKEAIKILKEELKLNGQSKEYSWKLDDAYKMAIVALAMTMTEQEKNTLEKPGKGEGDNYDKCFCPICGNTLWTIWQNFNRPDRCNICGQLIDNQPFRGVQDDK